MQIIVKILQGSECTIEVNTSSTIISVKERVANELHVPVNQQKLVFKGKTLSDDMCLKDYNITEGNKIHLFICESSQTHSSNSQTKQTILWDNLRKFLKNDYSPADVEKIIEQFKKNLHIDVNDLSLDEIERVAKFHLSQKTVI